MKKIIIYSCLSILISACGGGSGGGDSSSSALTAIAGVWDSSSQEGSVIDVSYTVFNTNGTFVDYDYLGDAFDGGADCYDDYNGTITDQGNGNFLLDNNNTIQMSVSGDTLEIISNGTTFTMIRSTRQESSFNLCNAGSSTPTPPATTDALSILDGIWDFSSVNNGLLDEFYTVYKNGEFIDYDYQGDAYNNGANCYIVSRGTIAHVSADTFRIDDIINLDFVRTGDSLDVSFEGQLLVTGLKSTLLESDFTPECGL